MIFCLYLKLEGQFYVFVYICAYIMKSSIGLNLRVTGHCNQGGRKYMEDAFIVAYQQNEEQDDLEYAYFGIFDGHGGREAALFAKEHLMNNIVSQKGFWSNDDQHVLQAIRNGFLATHHAMWREVGNWPKTMSGQPSTSGTTCSIAFIRKRKLYIGHVGDSKIVLGFQLPDSPDWCACPLTKDHKPESPEEKLRINKHGGLVLNKHGVERVVWSRPRPGHKGPIRRSTPFDQIPFLAVARSLGDLWSYNYLQDEFIVSPVPDVKVVNLNPHVHRCIIFASDGLWNMLTTQIAVRIVQTVEEENEQFILEGNRRSRDDKELRSPSKLLVEAALKHWFNMRMRADNTSVVTVMLDPTGPPRSHVLMRQRAMKRLRPRDEVMDTDMGDEEILETSSIGSKFPDHQASKDRKKTPEAPLIKGRKLTSDCEERIKNLPTPVIMNPQKYLINQPLTDEDGGKKPPPPSCPVILIKSRKSGHDPPIEDTTRKPLTLRKRKVGQEEISSLAVGNNRLSSAPLTDRRESAPKTNSNSKENGRVHLCEVNNLINDRTKETHQPDVVSPQFKPVPCSDMRKTLRRTAVFSTAAPRLRLSRRNLSSSCRGVVRRQSYVHNTRAQRSIQKCNV